MRSGEQVSPLELFFDLVFVLALTQCTPLMSDDPTWEGSARGLLVLGVLWWAWVGYAWLTSVVDPEEGAVRARDLRGDGRPDARGARRTGGLRRPRPHLRHRVRRRALRPHRALPDREPGRRRSSATPWSGWRSAPRSASALLVGGLVPRRRRPGRRCGPWRSLLDMGGPFLFGARGVAARSGALRRAPRPHPHHRPRRVDHRARRGRRGRAHRGVIAAASLGIGLAAALWWTYFDVVAIVAARRLERGHRRARAERAGPRLLLLPALPDGGRHRPRRPRPQEDPRPTSTIRCIAGAGFALARRVALYLLAHVAFRYRHIHTINRPASCSPASSWRSRLSRLPAPRSVRLPWRHGS